MQFLRLGPMGQEIPVALWQGQYFDLRAVTADIDGAFWSAQGAERVARALQRGELALVHDAQALRVGAPVARPQALLCIGLNYAAHAAESGMPAPQQPVLFFKHPNTLVGPNDAVAVPPGAARMDWEVELAVVIGQRASYLPSVAAARAHIAGYCVANDLSERRFQLERSGSQWGKGKSLPGFCPLGPMLVTPDEVSPENLRIRSWVNGEARQDSSTRDMIFSVDQIVHDLSQYLVLEPGDVILTGTPEGVAMSGRFPYLQAGDVVELEVEGLGRQRQQLT
ncbi:MAG: fumarylacetoacetate hydrolase family protein [Giesbergeria sp.]|nr:fumarylacetoacetate hydrolase family protein [Giesbergeria sp.]MBP6159056.1 fumarylacetoacetate hydrolase family protein [Giesbergeria sp.]MBP9782914.1 fumarylacetoacetate hydrolase family protein [Giesbergeria sp.]MBP9893846.1 fumarylacetoacetate hydrolase family protein [Giesbergeria sp.]